MTRNPNPTLLLSSSTLEGALSKEPLICQPMERFPKVPNSSSDASLSTSAMANITDNNKGKKKAGNGNRRNNREVKLSTDPQSVAARERRHRISERFKILQSLIPGGTKMDTASMLEEAIHYVKFLKTQIWLHQAMMGTMAEDIRLPPLPPSLYFLSNSLNPQDNSSVPPTSAELEQPITPSPSLPLYRYQADENHEAMFSNISINK